MEILNHYIRMDLLHIYVAQVVSSNTSIAEGISQNHIDGLMQERRNPIDNALELHLSCTNPSILL